MTVREYIGARYVPLFMGDWDNTKTYEPLSIVLNEGDSYTSRQYVPAGVDIDNEAYWAVTGNFNAQVEAYREEVLRFSGDIETLQNKFPITSTDINDGAITTAKIDDSAVTTAKIDDAAVTTAKINDGAVTTAKIDDAAVTTAKIDDAAVTTAKINDGAVTTAKVDDAAVTTAKIDDAAVTTAKIADGAVTLDKISNKLTKRLSISSDFLMPEYIGSFTNYSGMAKELNSSDDKPIYAQSMACPQDGEFRFFVVNKTNNNTHVVSASSNNNTVNESNTNHTTWGHCNCATYNRDNNRYYINVASDNDNQSYPILVTDSSFNEITRLAIPSGYYYPHLMYDNATGKMWCVGGTNIWEFNPATNTFTECDYDLSEPVVTIQEGNTYVLQSGAVYNNIYVCPIAATVGSGFKVYDITTGEFIRYFQLPKYSALYPIGEVEGCAFDSAGNFYFNSIMCYDTGFRYYSTTVLYKVNFFEGCLPYNKNYYSEQPENIYVECTNYNGFKSTGASEYPCKSLEEASFIIATVNKVRKVNFGLDSSYSNSTNQTWFGFLQITGANITIHWAGTGQITIRGGIISRDNSILKMRNRATFTPWANASGDSFIRVDDGILLTSTINTTANSSMNATFNQIVLCLGTGMFIANEILNNVGATKLVNNYNGGFGYVIQSSVKNGTW